jgi:hypothetical protein
MVWGELLGQDSWYQDLRLVMAYLDGIIPDFMSTFFECSIKPNIHMIIKSSAQALFHDALGIISEIIGAEVQECNYEAKPETFMKPVEHSRLATYAIIKS